MGHPSLAIHARWCHAHDGQAASLRHDCWILIEGETVAAITSDTPSHADRVIDHPNLLVVPGLINLHNHVFTEIMLRGLTEDLQTNQYETDLIYGLSMPIGQLGMRYLSQREQEAIIEFGLMQLVKGGVTTLMEPFRPELMASFASVAARVGLRLYAAPYLFSSPDLGLEASGEPTYGGSSGDDAAVAIWRDLYSRFHGASDLLHVVLSPHGTDTCGPDLFRQIRRIADEVGTPITTHLAQSRAEIATIRKRYGRTPAEYLQWLGVLGPDALLAHCIYTTDADLGLLKEANSTVLNCPRTFARGGISALFQRFSGKGLRTVIGTDGYDLDMISELRAAGIISKLAFDSAGVATARQLLDAVTTEAAAALGRSDIGRIAVGSRADLVAVNLAGAHQQPVRDPTNTLVWRSSGRDVWSTIVGGALIVDEGRYVHGNEADLTALASAAVEQVWAIRDRLL